MVRRWQDWQQTGKDPGRGYLYKGEKENSLTVGNVKPKMLGEDTGLNPAPGTRR